MKVLLVALIVAAVASAIITGLESAFGADKVFVGALIASPAVFIWCLATGNLQRK